MNDKKTQEYFEKLEGVHLSESSKVRIQRELLEYARFHRVGDVRTDAKDRFIGQVPQRTSIVQRFLRQV